MVESLPYNSKKGCPAGYHHRKGYQSSTGKYVEPRCVKAQTIYRQTSNEFKSGVTAKARAKLRGAKGKLGLTKKCPKGQVLRAPYARRYSSTVRKEGFNQRRGGKTVRVYPSASTVVVPAACIENRGLPGKGVPGGESIAPLRKGELAKYGYKAQLGRDARHKALKKAVEVYGPLGVFRKLDAITKLTLRTAPEAHKVFKADRDWIARSYTFKNK
jgi:hypothetical protein